MTDQFKQTIHKNSQKKTEAKILVFENSTNQETVIKPNEELELTWQIIGDKKLKINQKFFLHEGARLTINGVYNLKKESEIFHKIEVYHIGKNSQSEVKLKSVLNDKSKLELIGQINVEKNCSKVTSNLLHKTILLSRQTKVKTQPELKIKNDDVKCKHGATIGNLDEKAIDYMQTRGLSRENARGILIEAFLNNEEI